jgi:hypothetical protein
LLEKDLNRLIVKNINEQNEWCYKIPDPGKSEVFKTTERPFDGFAYTKDFGIVFENKFQKNEIKSFNLKNQIKSHQIENLSKIREITKNWQTKILCIVILGIYFPRKYTELFIFSIDYINNCLKNDKYSILKKELEKMHNENKTIIMKSGIFDINELIKKVISG